jgi:hypothetical protein
MANVRTVADACYLLSNVDNTETIVGQAQALIRSGWEWLGGASDLPVVFIFARQQPQLACREMVLLDIGHYWSDVSAQQQQRYIHYLVFYDPECTDRARHP